ncbi:hypothetical protein FGIG_02156 [Fasciola gigantica]|uniref:Oxoglutarate/iron-dependent oxygenase C-terminal degradation domain-containing protein n=1 Tax=Fasciola gigantica TaxID=46835 RepID=A0A504Z2S2_FASGI|nr:hypothetical protein FGIG_02156 [Fasciola gigantica]
MLVILSDLTGVRFHPESRMLDMKSPTVEDSSIPAVKRARTVEDMPTNISTSSSVSSQCASLTEPQLRRWSPGCYTLLADTELIGGNWRVEAVLHLAGYGLPLKRKKSNVASGEAVNSSKEPTSSCWDAAWGGQIVYVAKDEKDDWLTVRPSDNAFTLVYVGPDTANFVQYINHLAKPTPIHAAEVNHVTEAGDTKSFAYDLNLTYYEPASDVQSEAGADWAAAIEDGGSEDSVDDEEEDDADAEKDDEDDDDDAYGDDGNDSLIAESDK